MQKNIDNQALLNKVKKGDAAGFFHKRYGGYPCCLYPQCSQAIVENHSVYEERMKWGFFFSNWEKEDEWDWHWPKSELARVRHWFLSQCHVDRNFPQTFLADYLHHWHTFENVWNTYAAVDFVSQDPEKIVDILDAVYQAAKKQGIGYLVDSFMDSGIEDWSKDYLEQLAGRPLTSAQLDTLRTSSWTSFVSEVEQKIKKIALQKKSGEDISDAIANLQQEYFWIANNYFQANPKTVAEFAMDIQIGEEMDGHPKDQQHILAEKEALLDSIAASGHLRAVVTMLDNAAHIQDKRKQQVLMINHIFFAAYEALADKLGLAKNYVYQAVLPELRDIIKNPQAWSTVLEKRIHGALYIFGESTWAVYTKEELDEQALRQYFDYGEAKQELRGMPACAGQVTALARVIMSSKQFDQFQAGEILVTNQTTPDFVPLMKKAVAIIAEQGGVTSHAAVVSRELGIPCVVGVHDAMKHIQSGDMLEVDANTGIVKKI